MNIDPFHIVLALAFLSIVIAAVIRPIYALYAYLAIIFFFPNIGWGVDENVAIFNIYGKGTGVFPFSLVNIYLFGLFIISFLFWRNKQTAIAVCNIRKYFLIFNVLFIGYVTVGVLTGVSFHDAVAGDGVINVLNMTLVTLALLRMVSDQKEVNRLTNFVLVCALARGLWGTARFLFLGGDVANVYANVQKLAVKITFFDINDSLIACVATFYSAWMVTGSRYVLSRKQKVFYWFVIVVELFVITFSYRRTAWGGMLFAGILFCSILPWRRRIIAITVISMITAFILTVVTIQRFEKLSVKKDTGSMLLYDMRGSTKEGRFAELYRAFETIMEHPVVGVGPWGGYGPGERYKFMHSGFLHVWLKSGTLGMLTFLAMLTGFALFFISRRRHLTPEARGLYDTGMAGVLFIMPTLLMGTPIIEFRTMQLMGVCLALPYITYGVYARAKQAEERIADTHMRTHVMIRDLSECKTTTTAEASNR